MSVPANAPVLPPLDRFNSTLQHVPAPPEDRSLSSYTGMTRAHWVAVADDWLLSVARFASPSGSRLNLPGPVSQQGTGTDGLEAFARTFLLAAFLVRGNDGTDPHGHLARYLKGVRAGTAAWGSEDAESWPAIDHVGRDGQTHVEAASIALSLHLTKQWTWDLLEPWEQDRVCEWLATGLEKEPSSNNWYLFPFTIGSFLEGVGRADDRTRFVIDRGLALIEEWYRGEGWYSDGDGEAFDHYIGWALHLYPPLHALLRGDEPLQQRLSGRLHEFLITFARTFDRNGAPIYLGRSLTYRTGTLAAVALGEVLGATPLSPGQTRRVLSANLRYFLDRGATTDGVLSLGWHGPHEASLQRYSGPGSPYWASKGFAALLLGPTHPLWTAPEADLPGDEEDLVAPIAPTGLMIQATAADGLVRVHNHGTDHIKPHQADDGLPDPLYARLGYSTRTGPTALHNEPDNDIRVRCRGIWSVRRRVHSAGAGQDWVASWHAPRFPVPAPFRASSTGSSGPVLPSARIESVTLARGSIEVRVHRLRGLPPEHEVRASGWAIAADRPEQIQATRTERLVRVHTQEPLRSVLVPLHGWSGTATEVAPAGTAFGRWAVLPVLTARTAPGAAATTLLVAAAQLSADPDAADPSAIGLDVAGSGLAVRWGDGHISEIDLDDLPWPQRW